MKLKIQLALIGLLLMVHLWIQYTYFVDVNEMLQTRGAFMFLFDLVLNCLAFVAPGMFISTIIALIPFSKRSYTHRLIDITPVLTIVFGVIVILLFWYSRNDPSIVG